MACRVSLLIRELLIMKGPLSGWAGTTLERGTGFTLTPQVLTVLSLTPWVPQWMRLDERAVRNRRSASLGVPAAVGTAAHCPLDVEDDDARGAGSDGLG